MILFPYVSFPDRIAKTGTSTISTPGLKRSLSRLDKRHVWRVEILWSDRFFRNGGWIKVPTCSYHSETFKSAWSRFFLEDPFAVTAPKTGEEGFWGSTCQCFRAHEQRLGSKNSPFHVRSTELVGGLEHFFHMLYWEYLGVILPFDKYFSEG